MNYLISESFYLGKDFWEIGLYKHQNVWKIDTAYFGNLPITALRGELKQIVTKILKNYYKEA